MSLKYSSVYAHASSINAGPPKRAFRLGRALDRNANRTSISNVRIGQHLLHTMDGTKTPMVNASAAVSVSVSAPAAEVDGRSYTNSTWSLCRKVINLAWRQSYFIWVPVLGAPLISVARQVAIYKFIGIQYNPPRTLPEVPDSYTNSEKIYYGGPNIYILGWSKVRIRIRRCSPSLEKLTKTQNYKQIERLILWIAQSTKVRHTGPMANYDEYMTMYSMF